VGDEGGDIGLADLVDVAVAKVGLERPDVAEVVRPRARLQDGQMLLTVFLAQHAEGDLPEPGFLPSPLVLHGAGEKTQGLGAARRAGRALHPDPVELEADPPQLGAVPPVQGRHS
jgi:hypothetical protein